MTLLYYMLPFDSWNALAIVLGEWTGFVIIAYQIAKRTPLWAQIVLTPIAGLLWIFCFDLIALHLMAHYGVLKGNL